MSVSLVWLKFMWTFRADHDAEIGSVFDEMVQIYRRSKAEVARNGVQDLSDEDVQEMAKKFEKLEHYQDVIDKIFKN